uniref:Uncharacterized protein n=1 Tax=Cryptosporidium parvum TaxID=5807 RepID=F0X698_CRYPV
MNNHHPSIRKQIFNFPLKSLNPLVSSLYFILSSFLYFLGGKIKD